MEVLQIKTFNKKTCAKIYEAIGASYYEGDCHGLDSAIDFVFDEWITIKDLVVDSQLGADAFLTENGWYIPTVFVSHFRTFPI